MAKESYSLTCAPEEISSALLHWFAIYQRDLPWRRSRDPYRIWVSEVMLQQTRVETVIPYYERWLKQFPTLASLAEAPEAAVLKAWEGLGYYARARHLHQAAQEVVTHYGGEVPADPRLLSQLKGVGPYTAGAILSIVFNLPEPAVDGNVMRVLSRLCLIEDDIADGTTRKGMEDLVRTMIPVGQARDFNQALMELGARLCTPGTPLCAHCPVESLCRARSLGREGELPVKAKAKAPRPVDVVAGVILHEGKMLIARRPEKGLLGGLWEFPGGERPKRLSWEQALHHLLSERYGVTIHLESEIIRVRHIFTHLIWDLRAYCADLAPESPIPHESDTLRWVDLAGLRQFAFPVAHQKIIDQLALVLSGPKG